LQGHIGDAAQLFFACAAGGLNGQAVEDRGDVPRERRAVRAFWQIAVGDGSLASLADRSHGRLPELGQLATDGLVLLPACQCARDDQTPAFIAATLQLASTAERAVG
jgi:hypothetical protein